MHEARRREYSLAADDAVGIFSPQIAEAVNYRAAIAEEYHDKQFASLRTDLNYNSSGEHTFYAYYPYAEGQTAATTVCSIYCR